MPRELDQVDPRALNRQAMGNESVPIGLCIGGRNVPRAVGDLRRRSGRSREEPGEPRAGKRMHARPREITDATDAVGMGMTQDDMPHAIRADSTFLHGPTQEPSLRSRPRHTPGGKVAEAAPRREQVKNAEPHVDENDAGFRIND
jgi:hypothetical protein